MTIPFTPLLVCTDEKAKADLELCPVQWKADNVVARLFNVIQNADHRRRFHVAVNYTPYTKHPPDLSEGSAGGSNLLLLP